MLVPERGGASSPIGHGSQSPRPYPDSPLIVSNVPSPDNYVEVVESGGIGIETGDDRHHGSDNDRHRDAVNSVQQEPDNNNGPQEPDNAGEVLTQLESSKKGQLSNIDAGTVVDEIIVSPVLTE